MFCIIKRENHPDRGIEEVIGPFATRTLAEAEVSSQLKEDAKWYSNRPHDYDVWAMEFPED